MGRYLILPLIAIILVNFTSGLDLLGKNDQSNIPLESGKVKTLRGKARGATANLFLSYGNIKIKSNSKTIEFKTKNNEFDFVHAFLCLFLSECRILVKLKPNLK